jgi:hypothetical protein
MTHPHGIGIAEGYDLDVVAAGESLGVQLCAQAGADYGGAGTGGHRISLILTLFPLLDARLHAHAELSITKAS